jgi:hypothetical protein
MKKTALIFSCILAFTFAGSNAQTIKFDNGVTWNHLKGKNFPLFDQQIVAYSGLLGIEYLQHKLFYLSSEAGYIQLGGKETAGIGAPELKDTETWNYVHLNTTFRLQGGDPVNSFFIGAGPYLNVLMGDRNISHAVYNGYGAQRLNWGCKAEAGYNKHLGSIVLGVNASWLLPISATVKSPYTSLNARSLGLYLSLGYPLK